MFFSLLRLVFIIYCQKQKQKSQKKKKERKKRSNWTKLPRKSKEENNNNNRQRLNQKEKKNNNNKEEGIGIVHYRPNQKEKKKRKRQRIGQVHVQVHMGIFIIYLSNFSYSVFFLFWRENILLGPSVFSLDPTNFFLSPPPTKHLPKKFSFPFSFQNFPSHFLFKSFQLVKFLIVE